MAAVTTYDLTKNFRTGFWRPVSTRALGALSIEIPSGGVFGLLGPNGAGKSTTFKLLLGLLRPTSGSAAVLGGSPGDVTVHQRVGFLAENPTFYDHLTAEELLGYFAGLFGYRGEDRRRRVARVIDLVGIEGERRRPLREYSKGMTQRVGLAQALVNDPELIVLDEPMSGLDPIGRREVRALVAALGAEGRTVLLSSHILSDAEELCERVAILVGGRLVMAGRTAALTTGHARGWCITVAGAPESWPRHETWQIDSLGAGRVRITLGGDERPEPVVQALVALGARLESVTERRETLEDVFVRVLCEAPRASTLARPVDETRSAR